MCIRDSLVRSVARGLVARGVAAGQPVAILSPTRYEWTVLDFALWTAGTFAVPIYDSSSAEQIEWIISDSEVVAVITDSQASADRVRGAMLGRLGAEGTAMPDAGALRRRSASGSPEVGMSSSDWAAAGRSVGPDARVVGRWCPTPPGPVPAGRRRSIPPYRPNLRTT